MSPPKFSLEMHTLGLQIASSGEYLWTSGPNVAMMYRLGARDSLSQKLGGPPKFKICIVLELFLGPPRLGKLHVAHSYEWFLQP